ncbi:MAG: hypothetical protein E6I76_14290 [Chloroflexi bacterium]|nr:MAG: hypothetical protein E6I76_14290 [Chloroflexota bacterium]
MTVGGRDEAERARRWKELQRSARAVRALPAGDDPDAEDGELTGRHRAVAVSLAAATGLGGAVLGLTVAAPLPVLASNGTLDSNLFALTNQDRTSNGVGALSWNSTLGDIADGRPFACSGGVANGRTVDMIQRDYFDHPIPECGGQYADIMLTPDGVQWTAWGENIAWFSDPGIGAGDPTDAAANMNTIYMNSAPTRASTRWASARSSRRATRAPRTRGSPPRSSSRVPAAAVGPLRRRGRCRSRCAPRARSPRRSGFPPR